MAAADDPLIAQKEEAAVDAGTQRRFADLFDLRRIIGALFIVYGVILTLLGFGASDADVERAAGVNLNLWVGIGLLLVGAFFIAWALLRPVGAELVADDDDAGSAQTPAPVGVDAAAPPAARGSGSGSEARVSGSGSGSGTGARKAGE